VNCAHFSSASRRVLKELADSTVGRFLSTDDQWLTRLLPTLASLEAGLDHLNGDLEALGDLRNRARDAFPLINDNLEAITTRWSTAIDEMTKRNTEVLARHSDVHGDLEEGYSRLQQTAIEQQEQFRRSLEKIATSTRNELNQSADDSRHAMDQIWKEVRKQLREQVLELDKQLGVELGRALKMMSENPGGMSKQFVTDYGPLTKELARIVKMAPG
jgi:DNA anti-recombination protein RmuC